MNVLSELRNRFRQALTGLADDVEPFVAMVRSTQDPRHGDYQANFAMPLAARRPGTKARQVAEEVVGRLDVADLCEPPEVAGPGFINLRLKPDWIATAAGQAAVDPRLGLPPVAPQSIVIDFSSPNVAKPMHVGHLRSTVIGDALYRILKFLGHRVIADNHLGDWGTQFGMIIYGYKHFLDRSALGPDGLPNVTELARLYRLVNSLCDASEARASLAQEEAELKLRETRRDEFEATPVPTDKQARDAHRKTLKELNDAVDGQREAVKGAREKIDAVDNDPAKRSLAEAHPNILVDTRRETARLHAGDPENRGLWQKFMPACLKAMQAVYERLDVKFDVTLGESFYDPMLADVVADLQARGLATESQGAVCLFLEGFQAPFIVRKGDGAYTYATTDLATIRYRAQTFDAKRVLYVVDARQGDHFKMLFAAARKWGYDGIEYQHVSFGTVLGPNGKPIMTRAGGTTELEALLDDGVAFAREIVDENSPDLTPSERLQVSEIVGLGAIKYADLRNNRESDYQFNLSRMVSMKGDTATYMQYAFARICGIIRKAGTDRQDVRQSGAPLVVSHPSERALIVKLLQFPEALEPAAAECRPHYLTQYLFETANAFSAFYNDCPVKDAGTRELRASRLRICDLTAQILQTGLGLLGVKAVERM